MHGLGNDFILIDLDLLKQHDYAILSTMLNSKYIQFLCDRKLGIGADQLLVIEKLKNMHNNTNHTELEYNYRIFNADGSEVEHCGNGARCVVKYLFNQNLLHNNIIKLHTKNRIISGSVEFDKRIKISMGKPVFQPQDLDFINSDSLLDSKPNNYKFNYQQQTIIFGIVSIGNPHICIQLKTENELNDLNFLAQLAKNIQESGLFLKGINVNFFYLVDRQNIKLQTYERGCGFTLACGTGACATVSHGILNNLLDTKVHVIMSGGELNIKWQNQNQDKELFMLGDATSVFLGQLELCN